MLSVNISSIVLIWQQVIKILCISNLMSSDAFIIIIVVLKFPIIGVRFCLVTLFWK